MPAARGLDFGNHLAGLAIDDADRGGRRGVLDQDEAAVPEVRRVPRLGSAWACRAR